MKKKKKLNNNNIIKQTEQLNNQFGLMHFEKMRYIHKGIELIISTLLSIPGIAVPAGGQGAIAHPSF